MSRKTDNANKASKWLSTMKGSKEFTSAIKQCIESAKVYRNKLWTDEDMATCVRDIKFTTKLNLEFKCAIDITQETTYDALIRVRKLGTPTCVLDFASYYNPGGHYLKGSIAQEESLCAVSGLYPILSELPVYKTRSVEDNVPLEYKDELIYLESVPFTCIEGCTDKIFYSDVAAISAPNCNKIPIARAGLLPNIIKKRMESVFINAYVKGCKCLILGAWGCGVFKNDPVLIATILKELTNKYSSLFELIVFAIPNEKVFKVFKEIF